MQSEFGSKQNGIQFLEACMTNGLEDIGGVPLGILN